MQESKANYFSTCCPGCHRFFQLGGFCSAKFCPYCAAPLNEVIFETPSEEEVKWHSNRYQLMKSIGKGGMGEVYLAYDAACGRPIALKKIRTDLLSHPQVRHRFLKEAHITCQLTHPAIIPIYSIQASPKSAFYTMPFVEGETLKQLIRKTRKQEKNGEKLHHIGGSIPALMRIFITVCQAVAYAHSKDVLHRDLKLENIIVGKFGEVLILDWGLAKYLHIRQSDEDEFAEIPALPNPGHAEITRLGKVVGTVAYMAPERAQGSPATIQTDIYALGVILYQLLTLQAPFKRGKLKDFLQTISEETWVDPVLAAPYRDVPRMLARAVEKCLSSNPDDRYTNVGQLIRELENYLEGRSEWFLTAELQVKRKSDWEFQEHVLIADHIAITSNTDEAEWVNLMISHLSFPGNIRIETSVYLGSEASGIGFLLSVPETGKRNTLTDGYCLWLGSDKHRSTRLLRSQVEVIQAPDIFLKRHQWTKIRIEKIDKTLHLYLNDVLQLSYIAHIPIIGTHIGLLSRDADYQIEPMQVFSGSSNLTVSCLAVPDAFLAHQDFAEALSEYRRIANLFPDRAEGREALFRAGLTFIEQAKGMQDKTLLLDLALAEFEKLHGTPGGPLEYLGKALVYRSLSEEEEEIKCFEMAYRRYPKHPLLPILQEQILSRMHEVSAQNRMAAYRFILLSACRLPSSAFDTHTRRLFSNLQKHWEHLPFVETHTQKPGTPSSILRVAIPLAFWLAKPYILGEIIEDLHASRTQENEFDFFETFNALACLIELGAWDYALQIANNVHVESREANESLREINQMIACNCEPLEKICQELLNNPYKTVNFAKKRTLLYFLDCALEKKRTDLVHFVLDAMTHAELNFETSLQFNTRRIWAFLLKKNWSRAGEVLQAYPIELLNNSSTILHFLYGCWLQGTEGKEIAHIHFMGLLATPYPRTWTLAGHAIIGNLDKQNWLHKAFLWEKRALYRGLALYYTCAKNEILAKEYDQLAKQQYLENTQ